MTQKLKLLVITDQNWLVSDIISDLEERFSAEIVNSVTQNSDFAGYDVGLFFNSCYSFKYEVLVQRQLRAAKVPFIRAVFQREKAFVGPYEDTQRTGCLHCAEIWQKNAHPEKERWDQLYRSESLDQSEHQPWAPLQLEVVKALVVEDLLNWANTGESSYFLHQYVYNSLTDEAKRHRFMPNQLCLVCDQRPEDGPDHYRFKLQARIKTDPRSHRLPNPKLSLENLRTHFVDWRNGLVKHFFHDLHSPLLPLINAEMPLLYENGMENGFGRSLNVYESEMIAILEALERFAGHHPRGRRTAVHDSYNNLQADAIHPAEFGLHHPAQSSEPGYVLTPYSDDLETNWVWSYSFAQDRPVLVPEQVAYYRIINERRFPLNRFVYEISNGCALGGSREEAIFYGLMEVIERDAYLCTWYAQLPLNEIDIADIEHPTITALCTRVREMGYRIHFYDMSFGFGVPAIWVLLYNPSDDAAVKSYCAAGAHPNPEKAILGALVEAATSLPIYEKTMPEKRDLAKELHRNAGAVLEMSHHVLLYSLPESFDRLGFLLQPRAKKTLQETYPSWYSQEPVQDLTAELKTLVDHMLKDIHDVIVVDQTFPELEALGLHAVKVLVPGTLTMSFGHQYRRVIPQRVQTMARKSGLLNAPFELENINPEPHNFP